jgi:hypothetical protein
MQYGEAILRELNSRKLLSLKEIFDVKKIARFFLGTKLA